MTEFPGLRDALVRAAARRRRRRRAAAATVPVLAVGAVAVTLLALSREPPERERVAEPGATLEQAFAVFRRPQRPSDRPPSTAMVPGEVDRERTRELDEGLYAVPTETHAGPSLCLVLFAGRGTPTACAPVERAVDEATPLILAADGLTAVLVRDGTRDVRFFTEQSQGFGPVVDNAITHSSPAVRPGVSWTGASGTRYVHRPDALRGAKPWPLSCPRTVESLPPAALDRARREALIAVDQLYPRAVRATVEDTGPAGDTPCGELETVAVTLRLTAADRSWRGQVLVGSQAGRMRVVYRIR